MIPRGCVMVPQPLLPQNPMTRLRRAHLLAAVTFAGAAVLVVFGWAGHTVPPRRHGERKEQWSGREYLAQTAVESRPVTSPTAPGWEMERAWSGHDDWEPFVAADRSSPFVYQMTTRFNATVSGIFIRRSADGGATWLPDHLVAPIDQWQADPQVAVAENGVVFVAWLDGPDWMSKLVKSYDHGATWTTPVVIAPSLRWTDHPWVVVSPEGNDVYAGVNEDDSYMVASHDGGTTFGTPIRTSNTPGHWWDHNGAAIAPDGSIYFVAINYFLDYRGRAEINLISSHDRGASWQTTPIDRSAAPPGCAGAAGCEYGFLSSTASIAIDRAGTLMVAYSAGDAIKQPEPMYVTTSRDGAQWTPRVRVSQPGAAATNGFPGVAAGPEPGDFRVVWQGDNGNPQSWNTYYRRTTDGGASWGPIARLSDRARGAPYKHARGYLFPYGDYLGISVDGRGANHVIWGEGSSYNGPGGAWYTRGGGWAVARSELIPATPDWAAANLAVTSCAALARDYRVQPGCSQSYIRPGERARNLDTYGSKSAVAGPSGPPNVDRAAARSSPRRLAL